MHAELYIRAAKYDKARRRAQNFTHKTSKMTGEISDASFHDMVNARNANTQNAEIQEIRFAYDPASERSCIAGCICAEGCALYFAGGIL